MKTVLLGATKGMGRALARALAERGDDLFLLGRDPEDLERSAADLEARSGRGDAGRPGTAHCDLEDPATFEPALDAAEEHFGTDRGVDAEGLDTVVLTAGLFASQEELEADSERLARLLRVNFSHSVLFLEAARKRLLARGGGTLCAFSSVAGERGRKPVVLYASTKAGLTRYLEGLDHRYRAAGLRVVTVKPGFVKTGMTAHLDPPPFAGEPEQVARDVVKALDRGKPVIYTPGAWRWVMLVIRNLPRFVMRRIGF